MHSVVCAVVVRALLLLAPLPIPPRVGPTNTGDAAIGDALRLLQQPINTIRVLSAPEVQDVYRRMAATQPPRGLNAFRLPRDPNIYVNAESKMYRDAVRNRTEFDLVRLAATLLHEQIHETDGEYAARRVQADFIRSRLKGLPVSQRARGEHYWRTVEARAASLALAERARTRPARFDRR